VHHHHHHCDGHDLWLLIALAIILDQQQQPSRPPAPADGQGCAGCGSCLGSLVMLAVLIGAVLWLVHSNQKPVPSPTVTPAVYSYTYAEPPTPAVPDVAPRAELIAMPAQQPAPVRVLRATLVRLPIVRRATLVKWPPR
jgi:hypothetical protein